MTYNPNAQRVDVLQAALDAEGPMTVDRAQEVFAAAGLTVGRNDAWGLLLYLGGTIPDARRAPAQPTASATQQLDLFEALR